jgi:16S rRNA (guanine966-N2)-methyltransferase
VRVIAGRARGRHLKGPPPGRRGEGSAGARPSSDLVRGALFNALEAMGANFTSVLDLYSGTGALGIEALSRGAGTCDFVERDRAMVNVIRQNLEVTHFSGCAKVFPVAAERALERLSGPYTLVLADPPYADLKAPEILERVARSALVSDDATVVYEHSAKERPPDRLGPFLLAKQLRHGDSTVSIYVPAAGGSTGGGHC